FNKILIRYKDQGVLADNLESYRNGRRVLAVLAENKRKIKGIIHDESTTGKTVFMQPEETLALDSEFFELQNEERREIRKILKDLCSLLQEHRSTLISNLEVITTFDIIQAKALQGLALGIESAAKCVDRPVFDWHRAFHPLLLLKHKNNREAVIPFNLRLDDQQRIVVISGPNAGGKTITLKTVGLLCLMHQAGLLTPVDDHSTMGVFDQILTDIGDQQSIEHDLSTYTSHLQNMKVFTEEANHRTLFLIDEFGAGTEPTIGAAIAESILYRMHHLKARGVITTHYGNLKIMASKTNGIENASMAFDKEALAPTFQLDIGSPGSSFAFEMAQRSGLHEKIVHHARRKIGKKEGRLDFLLTSLQKEKNELEKKLQEVEDQEKKLQKLLQNYERMSLELEVRRKKLKLDEKQLELQRQSRANKDLEKAIREIRENQNLEKAKELAISLKSKKNELRESAESIHQEIEQKSRTVHTSKPFEVGDFVRMKIGGVSGAIQSIQKNKVTVLAGNMTLNVKLKDLEHAREPIDIQQQRSVNTHTQILQDVHHRIDVRGLRKEEAMVRLEQFVDRALVAGLAQIEIIHGKGNGVLKTLVTDILKTYSVSFDLRHPPHERGGDGVTLVTLE
ncbi:MAG: endonuclease MutS2, partial [Saprospiraceae bacterium]|nr:endonuclease MutS2 [Saprospiraceae bacterium]